MGRGHAEGYSKNPHVRLVAFCDRDENLAAAVAKQYGVKEIVTDYRKLLDRKDIQAVSVATPDQFHAEHTVAFMDAGKHILCEKPMAMTVAECEKMIAAADRNKVKFMIGQVCRFSPGFVMGKRLVEAGDIGKLYLVESEYAHTYKHSPGVGGWRKDSVRLRHPVLGGGCHAVDLLRWIAGNMAECFAYANHYCLTDWPVDDCTIAVYKFQSGVVGKVMCSIGCVRPYTMRSVFYGTEGTIICDNRSPQVQICSHKLMYGAPEFSSIPVPQPAAKPMVEEVGMFVDCVVNNKPVPMDARQGACTVAACLAAVESAASGKAVKVRSDF
jgi:predicted dehydrogenase